MRSGPHSELHELLSMPFNQTSEQEESESSTRKYVFLIKFHKCVCAMKFFLTVSLVLCDWQNEQEEEEENDGRKHPKRVI